MQWSAACVPLHRLSKVFYEAYPRAGNPKQHIARTRGANAETQERRADVPPDAATGECRVKGAKPKGLPPAPTH